MDDLNDKIEDSKQNKTRQNPQFQTTANILLRKKKKKDFSKVTVITIVKYKEEKFQVGAGNGDAHSIPGSFNDQECKFQQVVATHLCLRVK